jgi:hypothetical protein
VVSEESTEDAAEIAAAGDTPEVEEEPELDEEPDLAAVQEESEEEEEPKLDEVPDLAAVQEESEEEAEPAEPAEEPDEEEPVTAEEEEAEGEAEAKPKKPLHLPKSKPSDYGEETQTEQTDDELDEDEISSNVGSIIRYMDRLEPGKNYSKRQQDTRGGFYKTIRELTEYQQQNTNDRAISWHKVGDVWCPPNQETLNALIELLKVIISAM